MEQPTAPPLPPAGPEAGKAGPNPMDKEMNPLAVVGVFALLGLSFYFMFTYTGPFQWLAELQLKWMDSYSEKLTLILTMVVLLVPAGAVWKLIDVAVKKMGPGGATVGAVGGGSYRKSRNIRLPPVTILPLLGFIALGIGGFMYWRGATAGPLTAVGGLPGPVRVSFEKSLFKPAAGYLVIETKEEPAKLMRFGKWPMMVGAALVAAGLLVWGVKRMVAGRG